MAIRLIFSLLVVAGLFSPEIVFADGDQSSPKAAMKSFWSAIDKGDADAAKKLCKYGEVQGKWIDSFAGMCDGFRKLRDSGTKRFGADAKIFAEHTPAYYAEQLIDQCTFQESGDTAVLTPPRGKARGTAMVKEDGKWFVVLKKDPADQLATATIYYQAFADASREVVKNMDDGKYASATEADTDLRERVGKAMPQTRPAETKN